MRWERWGSLEGKVSTEFELSLKLPGGKVAWASETRAQQRGLS